ncbi:MAG: hypothetical protein AAB932_03140 [Patescibacteria group bacterium]
MHQKLKVFFSTYAILFLSIGIGLLMSIPPIYFHYFEPSYRGIELFGSDVEEIYVSQIREIYDGHYSFGNIYLADLKNSPYIQQSLSPAFVALLGVLLQVSAPAINILTKFFFPVIVSMLAYTLFKDLSKRTDTALLLTIFVLLAPATLIFLNPADWYPLLAHQELHGVNFQFLAYARPINPEVSSIVFFAYLICVGRYFFSDTVSTQARRWYGIAATVLLGVSFYTYFFAFTLLFGATGMLALWFLISRRWKMFRKAFVVLFGACVLGIPYFMNVWKVMQSPYYRQVAQHLGAFDTHRFIVSKVWWGSFLALLFLYPRNDRFRPLFTALLMAAMVLTNQQVITGHMLPIPSHYHWYYIGPLGGAILLRCLFMYIERFTSARIYAICFIAAFGLFFYSGILMQVQSYHAQRGIFVAKQRYADVVTMLEQQITPERVIFANSTISGLIPAYTRHNVYYHGGMGDFLVSEERRRHGYYVYLFLQGIDNGTVENYFSHPEHLDEAGALIFSMKYRVSNGCYGCFPEKVRRDIISGYKDFLKNDFLGELSRYPLDYVVWDSIADPSWHVERYFHAKIYEKDGIIVYQTT